MLWDIERELMVPVTVDAEVDGVRVVDTLVWDIHQQVRTTASSFSIGYRTRYSSFESKLSSAGQASKRSC